jgi:hypothetical protein
MSILRQRSFNFKGFYAELFTIVEEILIWDLLDLIVQFRDMELQLGVLIWFLIDFVDEELYFFWFTYIMLSGLEGESLSERYVLLNELLALYFHVRVRGKSSL